MKKSISLININKKEMNRICGGREHVSCTHSCPKGDNWTNLSNGIESMANETAKVATNKISKASCTNSMSKSSL